MINFTAVIWRLVLVSSLAALVWTATAHAVATPSDLCPAALPSSQPLIRTQALTNCLANKQVEVKDQAVLLKLRAKEYLQLGRFNQALDDFNTALELQPNDAEIYNGRGIVYKRLGDYKLAMQDYAFAQDLRARQPEPSVIFQPQPIFSPEPIPQEIIEIERIRANLNKRVFGYPEQENGQSGILETPASLEHTDIKISKLVPIETGRGTTAIQ